MNISKLMAATATRVMGLGPVTVTSRVSGASGPDYIFDHQAVALLDHSGSALLESGPDGRLAGEISLPVRVTGWTATTERVS